MKNKERFDYLLAGYLNDTASFKEKTEFFELVATGDFDEMLENQFENDFFSPEDNNTTIITHPGNTDFDTLLNAAESRVIEVENKKSRLSVLFSAAASVVLLLSLATLYFFYNANPAETFTAAFKKNNQEKITNKTKLVFPVSLPDGSLVSLQPNSSLYYSKQNFAYKREIFIEGEAGFDIAKDTANPFYVFYQGIVTKVLGTTFNVGTNKKSGNIEVKVFTGKVWVYENEKIYDQPKISKPVILTPNQRAIYTDAKRTFETKLVDKPLLINAKSKSENKKNGNKLPDFNFENTKLVTVLTRIGASYGIEITAANEQISQCEFSGNLSSEDLYDKLKIVCLATNSSYEINGTAILIKGDGCK